jgi:hypothetical protein
MYGMRWVVTLGIESGRKLEHVGGTKFHAEAARFAALYNDRNTSFCHEISTVKVVELTTKYDVIMP